MPRRRSTNTTWHQPVDTPQPGAYDAIILAVGHDQFRALGARRAPLRQATGSVLFDVKYVLPREAVDGRNL
jgi:UDP-N-acetyl-D-galactosamine dehydrogenase